MPFAGLLISGGASLFSGLLGAGAASSAAGAQEQGEQQVLDLLKQIQPQAQGDISSGVAGANSTLSSTYGNDLGLLAPYLSSGSTALQQLNAMVGSGGFQAPTSVTEANDPGYQFREQQGQLALQRAQSSTGSAEGGAAAKELSQYNQNYASNEYNNVYNRALGTYQTNFGNLSALAGMGLSATNTGVGASNLTGTQSAGNTFAGGQLEANNLMQGLGISADALTGAANARASGYVGGANALGGAATNFGNAATSYTNGQSQLALLQQLLARSGSSTSYANLAPNGDTYA